MQDSGQPEDAGTAKPEGAGTEATRGTISRRRGTREFGATRKLQPKAKPEGERGGATRNHTERRSWRAMPRGNPKHQHRGAEGRDSGQLEEPSPAQPEDAGTGATRGWHQQAQSEGRATEETPSSSAGGAEGCEIRGNPKIHCRQGRKMQKPGQPGGRIGRRDQRTRCGATRASTKEAPKDARRGNSDSVAGRTRRCRMRGNSQPHREARLEEQGREA